MSESDDALVDALREARNRRPWTERAIRECGNDPAGLKADAEQCQSCPEPCRDGEVCATVVASHAGLLRTVGRAQAFHLVESAVRRLCLRGEASDRRVDRQRPNTFVTLQRERPDDDD